MTQRKRRGQKFNAENLQSANETGAIGWIKNNPSRGGWD
jgi:hypothetical protein